jgi:hypothetical protein
MPSLRPRAVVQYSSADTDQTLDDTSNTGNKQTDSTYFQRVLAYIPVESIALYQAAVNEFGPSDQFFTNIVRTIWIVTPFWMLYSTHKKGQTWAWDQAVSSIPAFIFWLAGLQSPFVKDFFAASDGR